MIKTYTIGINDTQVITYQVDEDNRMVSANLDWVDIMELLERYGIEDSVQMDYGRREA